MLCGFSLQGFLSLVKVNKMVFLSARVESPELSGFFLPRSSSGNPALKGFKAAIHEWVNYFAVHIYLFE